MSNVKSTRMNNKLGPHHVVALSPERRLMINVLNMPGSNHRMYGLLEVDVTVAREFIAAHKARTGETLSFTGFLTHCLARAVDKDKSVQAVLKGQKQLVLFDDVDVGLMIEGKIGEKKVLMGHVIRGANHKTYREIHQEIRSVQSTPVPPNKEAPAWFRSAMLLPSPLSGLFNSLVGMVMRHDPTIPVSLMGTVGITSIGMFGEGHSGWGIFPVIQVLGLIVGTITLKPVVVEDRIEPREILNLTVVFDHNVIDGAPAARFTQRLTQLIESGYGLDENESAETPETEPVTARRKRVAAWQMIDNPLLSAQK